MLFRDQPVNAIFKRPKNSLFRGDLRKQFLGEQKKLFRGDLKNRNFGTEIIIFRVDLKKIFSGYRQNHLFVGNGKSDFSRPKK